MSQPHLADVPRPAICAAVACPFCTVLGHAERLLEGCYLMHVPLQFYPLNDAVSAVIHVPADLEEEVGEQARGQAPLEQRLSSRPLTEVGILDARCHWRHSSLRTGSISCLSRHIEPRGGP